MTQENKELLLQDLCARLPYKVIVEIVSYADETSNPWFGELSCKDLDCFIHDVAYKSIKPYLRPMSSMTDEEKMEFIDATDGELRYSEVFDTIKPMHESEDYCASFVSYLKGIVWLDKKMFDYRGLIPLGLAIEVTEENNPYL